MLGANKSLLALMLDLRERYNLKPLVLMYDTKDGSLAEELEINNIQYIISPMKFWVVGKKTKFKYLRGIKGYIENITNINTIYNIIQNDNISLVYTNNSTVQIGAMLAEKLKVPHIWHIREFGADCGGTSELIDDNQTGILYKIGNIQEISDNMKKIITNRVLLKEMVLKKGLINQNCYFSVWGYGIWKNRYQDLQKLQSRLYR